MLAADRFQGGDALVAALAVEQQASHRSLITDADSGLAAQAFGGQSDRSGVCASPPGSNPARLFNV
jgi:hypothetical protein